MTKDKKPEQRVPGRRNFPSECVDPTNFLENEDVEKLLNSSEPLTQDDALKIFNCVHCNECTTSDARARLMKKYVDEGNSFEGMEELVQNFKQHDTPYQTNKMRIKLPKGIPETSDRLFFMGCLSTIKIPQFTENALKYLLSRNIDFTTLKTETCCGYPVYASGLFDEYERVKAKNAEIFEEYQEVLCLCPACYFLFTTDYPKVSTRFTFIADYLQPPAEPKQGSVSIQHMCQMQNRGHPETSVQETALLQESGYDVIDIPHWCCGGGKGYMYRTDIIDKIAAIRMQDFAGDYMTTMCPGCYWIMKVYGGKAKSHVRLKDMFELLT
ncbi:MAG TPA: (Fe-S)-binding protein [Candidatus Lokiarchaeia archaeon]|nr:(Fe-S)-binding protein [Candidatus Lokiarchaeia archaeon]